MPQPFSLPSVHGSDSLGAQLVADLAQDAPQLHVTPVAAKAVLRREIGQLLVVLHRYALEPFDQAQVARVDVVARTLDGYSKMTVVRPIRRPADLHVAVEHHARRAPIVDRVREHVAVHEQAVGLAGEDRAPLTVRMAQPERGLAGVGTGAEQVELELEIERRVVLAGRHRALHAEAALLDADARLAVAAVLSVDADLRGPQRVVPLRSQPAAEVLDVVRLGESIDFERKSSFLSHGGRAREQHGRDRGRQRDNHKTLCFQQFTSLHSRSPWIESLAHAQRQRWPVAYGASLGRAGQCMLALRAYGF